MARSYHAETLIRTPVATVYDCHCCAPAGNSKTAEYSDTYEFILPRRGVFEVQRGGERAVADPNNLLFFNRDDEYCVNHPGDCGDTCTVIYFDGDVFAELAEEAGLRATNFGTLLPYRAMTIDGPLVMAHHALLQLMRQTKVDPLAAEESLILFAGEVLERLVQRQGGTGAVFDQVPQAAVDSVKSFLAARPEINHTLDDLSKRSGYSRYYLCRLFRAESGISIYRYLLELRVRIALDHIAEGATDLTKLALDLGFSSHSHFSFIFRSLTGMTPTAFRTARTDELRTIMKA